MTALLLPHRRTTVQQHSTVPYLWRATCSCGHAALAGNQSDALLALESHSAAEEPFPDLDLPGDADSEAARREQES